MVTTLRTNLSGDCHLNAGLTQRMLNAVNASLTHFVAPSVGFGYDQSDIRDTICTSILTPRTG